MLRPVASEAKRSARCVMLLSAGTGTTPRRGARWGRTSRSGNAAGSLLVGAGDLAGPDRRPASRGVEPRAVEDRLAQGRKLVARRGGDLREQARLGHAGQRVDLEHVFVLAARDEEVDAAGAGDAEGARRAVGEVEHAAVTRGREACGHEVLRHSRRVLRLVVVEAALRDDLDRAERSAVE